MTIQHEPIDIQKKNQRTVAACLLAVREVMPEHVGVDSCIFTTHVLIRSLRELGIYAFPLATSLKASNLDADTHVMLGSGRNDVPTNPIWPWHLIAIANVGNGYRALVDPTVEQMNDHIGMELVPLMSLCPADYPTRDGDEHSAYQNLSGRIARLTYVARTSVRTFETSPDWHHEPIATPFVSRIVPRARQIAPNLLRLAALPKTMPSA